MKQKNKEVDFFLKIKNELKNNNTVVVDFQHPSFILILLSLFERDRKFVFGKVSILTDIVYSYDVDDISFCGLVSSKTPKKQFFPNIKNPLDIIFNVSTDRCVSSWKKIKTCVVENCFVDKKLVSTTKNTGMVVNKKTKFDVLVSFLNKNYTKKNSLSSVGEFVVRGGVVDVFPYGQKNFFRLSFLDGEVSVYVVEPSTGFVVKNKKEVVLYPLSKNNLSSFNEVVSNKDIVFFCFENRVEFSLGLEKKKKNTKLKTFLVSFNDYNKIKKNNPSVIFYDFLNINGFVFNNTFFLPAWFNKKNTKKTKGIDSKTSLVVGDYYIHEDFGVCCFLGVENNVNNVGCERLCLKFEDGFVRVSVKEIGKLFFFSHDKKTKLNSLSKRGLWVRKKQKSFLIAKKYVGSLLHTYKKRSFIKRTPYVVDFSLLDEFSSGFPFLETPDQTKAIKDVCVDFSKKTPMTRLLCGDVGFGKTEIALRGAFLSYINNKKTIIVAPTRVLADQLFGVFVERFKYCDCVVVFFETFLRNTKKNSTLSYFKKCDILIGTQSLLKNKDILSLCSFLVVDDEHKFGVKDKEFVFTANPSVDVLYMSATPLPRTLQMSVSKIRNISLLKTPPFSRKPIITNLYIFSKPFLKKIILNEFARGGQIYIVDNSVNNVVFLHSFVKTFIDNNLIGVLHARLPFEDIKKTMRLFRFGFLKILISTVIVESGIDVGCADSIIINNSHLFGLSQLYQLRGRVGRSPNQAFAHLFVPSVDIVTDTGRARLDSLVKHTALGSGYFIAFEDLKIRGAGSLFGYEQSGDGGVGFEYYSSLLSSALSLYDSGLVVKGGCVVDLKGGFVPSSYVFNQKDRLLLYKSVFGCESFDAVSVLLEKTTLLYGPPPSSVFVLFDSKKISLLFGGSSVGLVKEVSGDVFYYINKPFSFFDRKKTKPLFDFFNKQGVSFSFSPDGVGSKFQYKKTSKDDYILAEFIWSILKNVYFLFLFFCLFYFF